VGGTSTVYSTTASGSYGIEGASDPTNLPPARSAAAAWRDTAGNLWLFGGVGVAPMGSASPSQLGLMNDLWLYEPNTGLWTWVNGSNQTVPDGSYSAVYGTLGVAAPANMPTARAGANAWSDASGNLWLFGGQYAVIGQGTPALNDLWEYNPTTNLWTWMSGSAPGSDYSLTSPSGGGTYGREGTAAAANTPGERWGGGAWTDATGKFWLFGGVTPGTNPDICCSVSNDLWSYDPATGEWTWVSGSMVSGSTPAGTYGAIGVSGVGNVLAGRANPVMAGDGNGNLWIYGGSAWKGNRDDLWRFSLPQ
jgi:N-acetylneuraminic acid mutarotase